MAANRIANASNSILLVLGILLLRETAIAQTRVTVTPVNGPPVTFNISAPIQVQPLTGSNALQVSQLPGVAVQTVTIEHKDKLHLVTASGNGKMFHNGQETPQVTINPEGPPEAATPPAQYPPPSDKGEEPQDSSRSSRGSDNVVTATPTPPDQPPPDANLEEPEETKASRPINWWLRVFGAIGFLVGTVGVLKSERRSGWVILQCGGVASLLLGFN